MREIIYNHALTVADVKSLRTATAVSFHYATSDNSGYPDKPASFIKASYEKTHERGGFSKWEHYVPAGHRASIYGEEYGYGLAELESAFEMISSAQLDPVWQTIASLLRAGDVLALHWVAGGKTNQYHKDAKLYGDELQLVVQRGKRILTFTVDTSCNPGNTARMCKPRRRKEAA